MSSAGRPTKLTPEVQRELVSVLKTSATRGEAAALVGIDYSTFHRWMVRGAAEASGRYAAFRRAVLKAEASARIIARAAMLKAAQNGNVAAMKHVLDRKPPKELSEHAHDSVILEETRRAVREQLMHPVTCALLDLRDQLPEDCLEQIAEEVYQRAAEMQPQRRLIRPAKPTKDDADPTDGAP